MSRQSINDLLNEIFTLECKKCGKKLVIAPTHTGFGEYQRVGSSECYCHDAIVELEVHHAKRLGRVSSDDVGGRP